MTDTCPDTETPPVGRLGALGVGKLGAPGSPLPVGKLGAPGSPPLGKLGAPGSPLPVGKLGAPGSPPLGKLGAPGSPLPVGKLGAEAGVMHSCAPLPEAVTDPLPTGELAEPPPEAETGLPVVGALGVAKQLAPAGSDVGTPGTDAALANAAGTPLERAPPGNQRDHC